MGLKCQTLTSTTADSAQPLKSDEIELGWAIHVSEGSVAIKFIEDTKLFLMVKTEMDYEELQEVIFKLSEKSTRQQMMFSVPKCMVMHKDVASVCDTEKVNHGVNFQERDWT